MSVMTWVLLLRRGPWRGGGRNPRGNVSIALSTGSGVRPPSAQSEPSSMVSQRSSSSVRFAARSLSAMIRSITSTPRVEPMRQGVHLPQDSMAQNSMAKRACWARSTVSSNTTMPPWPTMPFCGGERLVVQRQCRAGWPGNRRRAGRRPAPRASAGRVAVPPPIVVDQLAQRQAEGLLDQAAVLDVAGELERQRAARAAHAEVRVEGRALGEDDRHGGEARSRC